MDRLLRSAKLETDPNARYFRQALAKTFEKFVTVVENGRDEYDFDIKKYGLLIQI